MIETEWIVMGHEMIEEAGVHLHRLTLHAATLRRSGEVGAVDATLPLADILGPGKPMEIIMLVRDGTEDGRFTCSVKDRLQVFPTGEQHITLRVNDGPLLDADLDEGPSLNRVRVVGAHQT